MNVIIVRVMDFVRKAVIAVPQDKSYLLQSHETLRTPEIIKCILKKLKQKY